MSPDKTMTKKYPLNKNRYKELLYFCRQYPDWVKLVNSIPEVKSPVYVDLRFKTTIYVNPTFETVAKKEALSKKIELVEQAALATDGDLYSYILKGVTEGWSYDQLTLIEIPCSRSTYYDRYRKFFFILDKIQHQST